MDRNKSIKIRPVEVPYTSSGDPDYLWGLAMLSVEESGANPNRVYEKLLRGTYRNGNRSGEESG